MPPVPSDPPVPTTGAFEHASADAELYCEPSDEARRLLRLLGGLTSPADGQGTRLQRAARTFLVAPFTQLTFLSFDLQMFLFDVFHTSRVARVGHAVGMTGVTFAWLALAVTVTGTPAAAWVLGAALLVWYASVARSVGLWAWWVVMVPILVGLAAGAEWLAGTEGLGVVLACGASSGAVISLSHAAEPMYPPRAGHPHEWTPLWGYIRGAPGDRLLPRLSRGGRVGAFALIGWVNELWAAPRLLPYNVLRGMMAIGYAPALKAVLDDRAARAWASGNPALDYVGVGGGTYLRRDTWSR